MLLEAGPCAACGDGSGALGWQPPGLSPAPGSGLQASPEGFSESFGGRLWPVTNQIKQMLGCWNRAVWLVHGLLWIFSAVTAETFFPGVICKGCFDSGACGLCVLAVHTVPSRRSSLLLFALLLSAADPLPPPVPCSSAEGRGWTHSCFFAGNRVALNCMGMQITSALGLEQCALSEVYTL